MSPITILIVEDEENVRRGLEGILIQAGYRVTGVSSGEEAIELVTTHRFDLALLDIRLKGVNGIDVLRKVRETSPDTVTIMLTAHASLESAVEALRYGAHDYLFKPCSAAELRESIRRGLLERRASWQRNLLRQLDDMTGQLDHIRATLTDWQEHPQPEPEPAEVQQDRFLERGILVVDFMRHLISLDGHLLDLSLTEFNLLAYLIREAPRVVSPQELLDQVQEIDVDTWQTKGLVRQYVYRLRQKILDTTGRDDVIATIRGVGYSINEQIF